MSIGLNDTGADTDVDRRVSVRRKEDYFWLKRLADLTGEACLVINREMGIEFADHKVFDLLCMDPIPADQFTSLSQLTTKMAENGYFGKGDPKIFEALIADLLTNQRLKQNTATQIISAVTPSGRHIDIRVSLGRDDGFLLLMRDITHEELKKSVLNTALKVGESGYWYYNLKSKEFHVRADSLRPYFSQESYDKIKSEGFAHVIYPDDADLSRDTVRKAIDTCLPQVGTVRVLGDTGGVHWLKWHVMPNIDEGGTVRSLSCFFTTVTQQVQVEQQLRQAQMTAESSLKAKNEFLGRLSHEVRTPLNAVIGMADALVHNCNDQSILPQLTLIQNSAEKLIEMVEGTLQHTKLADDAVELNLRKFSPKALIESVYSQWKDRAAANGTKLSVVVHPNVPDTMVFDTYRYEQCISNLLSNAIKFTPGGNVKLMLAAKGDGAKRQLVAAVRDDGIGITETSISDIFLPFKQADKSISSRFGGTGLGLSIVKDLVELMGGRINVTSKPGKGTLFGIAIPIPEENLSNESQDRPAAISETQIAAQTETGLETPKVPETAPPQQPSLQPLSYVGSQNEVKDLPGFPKSPTYTQKPAAELLGEITADPDHTPSTDLDSEQPYNSLKILIVDDNATNHIVVNSLLGNIVGETTTALNGQEALEQLKEKPFDLVLMDIHMPIMDGIETTLAIRSEPSSFQNIPIIALTADPQYQQARLCRNIGMNSSLGKPIKLAALLQAFDEVLFDKTDGVASAA